MENCFVKELKASFADRLPRLGALTFEIKNATAGWRGGFSMSSGTGIVSYSDGGYVTTGSGSDTKSSDTASVGTNLANIYSCSGNYILFFDDGYNAKTIDFSDIMNDNIACDISQFKYRKHAQSIRVVESLSSDNQGYMFGDIEAFAELTDLESISIQGSYNVIGDISVLKDLVSLTSLDFMNTKVSGSYESLLSGMCANRTSGNMVLSCRNADVTLHNVSVGSVRHKIVFSATGCEVQPYSGGTAIATYTKASDTWTYA